MRNGKNTVAAVFYKGGQPIEVELSFSRDSISFYPLNNSFHVRWPLAGIVQSEDEGARILLRWPPRDEILVICDREGLARNGWDRKLPNVIHQSRFSRAYIAVAFSVFMALGFWLAIPSLVTSIPFSWEKRILADIPLYSSKQICDGNAAARSALLKIQQRLFPSLQDDADFDISITVVHDSHINAFATLGGRIYILDGLLKNAQSPEELAGILAHEIEHVRRRHVLYSLVYRILGAYAGGYIGSGIDGSIVRLFSTLQFSRSQEQDADEGALRRLLATHVDPHGIAAFFRRLSSSEKTVILLSDHPASYSRADLFSGVNDDFEPKPILSENEWQQLKVICTVKAL